MTRADNLRVEAERTDVPALRDALLRRASYEETRDWDSHTPMQWHHAVYAQEVRRNGGDLNDERNLLPVQRREHERHHSRVEPFQLSRLPDSAFEYAAELLGPEKAYEYLRRRYSGEDPRLDALLTQEDPDD